MGLAGDGFGLLAIDQAAPEVLAGFTCGKQHIDEFLKAQAAIWHKKRLGFTSVVFHRDVPGVVGYFTLANDALPLKASEQMELDLGDVSLSAFPAVKLGRLAIASHLQGQGVGKQVMDLVHGEVLESASRSAARLVIVDADNEERVVAFYRGLGYQESLWAEGLAKHHAAKSKSNVRPAAVKMLRDVFS